MKLIRKELKKYVCKDVEDIIMKYITEKCFDCKEILLSRHLININRGEFRICLNCVNNKILTSSESMWLRRYIRCLECREYYTRKNFYKVEYNTCFSCFVPVPFPFKN